MHRYFYHSRQARTESQLNNDGEPKIGVEIVKNEVSNEYRGTGRYYKKIFHIGAVLPSWLRAILPKSALMLVEESWNSYPFTRTKYSCPFMEKFCVDVETVYAQDAGTQVG